MQDLMLLQNNLAVIFRSIVDITILDGVYLTNVPLATTTTFTHTLGRIPQGYILCDVSAATTIYRKAWTASTITLVTSSSATVSLWIF